MLRPDSVTVIFGRRGSGKSFLARALLAPYPRLIVVDPLHEYKGLETFDLSLPLFDRAATAEHFRLCYQPADPELAGDALWRALFWLKDYLLVIDEADQFAPVNRWASRWLKRIIMHGRHQGISLITVVRRPAELNRGVSSQAAQLFTFYQQEPRDVAYIREFTGLEAEQLAGLGQHEALLWTDQGVRRVKAGRDRVTASPSPTPNR